MDKDVHIYDAQINLDENGKLYIFIPKHLDLKPHDIIEVTIKKYSDS